MLSRAIKHIDPRLVVVDLADRQRQQELDCSDLIPSIRKHGILQPILLEEGTDRIIFGWRRLTSAIFLDMKEIPVRYGKDLTHLELKELEFEENARRKDLTWQDNARAIHGLHSLKQAINPDWTAEDTAQFYNYSERHINRMLALAEAILEGDQSIIQADTYANANTLLERRKARAAGDAINSLLDMERKTVGGSATAVLSSSSGTTAEAGQPASGGDSVLDPPREVSPPYSIVHADAHEFLTAYDGPKFNLLHCDLPYGVALNTQAGQAQFEGGGYESSPDIYWALVESLIQSWDRIMYPSSHIVFWISMKFYSETVRVFQDAAASRKFIPPDLRINPTPLIWHKTDNKGIISDAMRGPRNVYEAALLMSTGDRHIVKPVSNVYGCPTAKGDDAIHTNEKPEPMLRHFFSMLVDGRSRVFDPTAGSGSSIRTAESLGAEAALGLEFNPEFASRAQKKLLSARGLRQLSAVVDQAEASQASSALDSILEGD
jgi:ParB/RepB/Spo0J family partition protein